ncbi:hypothetical protein PV326_011130, partial [Microctonus aethiopoides]
AYPSSAPDWSPGYDISSLESDIEIELPRIDMYDCLVKNGDLANNNRDDQEGRHTICKREPPRRNDPWMLDPLHPGGHATVEALKAVSNRFEMENGIGNGLVRPVETHAPGQLAQQAGLVNLQADPPEISADRNVDVWVYARRQHPLLLKKSEEDGCFHLEMSNMMVGPVLLPANTLKCVH